jgi:tripartite-type tricarboxylate transporter receptor subunit TctC
MWSNKLRPAERPNYAELRLKQINDSAWYGLVTLAKTPNDIIKRLHAAVRKVQAKSEVKERIAASGSEATSSSPAEFGAGIKSTFNKTKNIVKEQGIKLDANAQ